MEILLCLIYSQFGGPERLASHMVFLKNGVRDGEILINVGNLQNPQK